jgi:hypothetical protein
VTHLGAYTVLAQENLPDGFDHRWPKREQSTQYRPTEDVATTRYRVRTTEGEYSLLIGAELRGRESYDLPGRGRIVIFVQRGAGTAGLYPLVEFAETDELDEQGRHLYAAGIPRSDHPRSLVTGDQLQQLEGVAHLQNADIRRADEAYRSVQDGPSLRLIVRVNDAERMVEHGLWVGQLRGGGRLPRPA